MKLIHVGSILLLALITSAQCQQTAEDWFDKGKDLDNQGKYADAIDAYHEAIVINPELGGVRDRLEAASVKYGEILLADGKDLQAVASCDEAIKINPDNENAWLCKARAICSSPYDFGVRGNEAYEKADKAYGEVIRINPDNADAWYERAFVLWILEKEDKSAKAYDEVIRINPQHDKAWNAKGEAHDRRGEYDEAVKAFDEAIRLEPDNLEYQENRRKSLAHAAVSQL
jgi:tetratricopeptide (TPR) repeat protein